MLVHLISDLVKDKTLRVELSQNPGIVFERYGVEDLGSLNSNGLDTILERVSKEIKDTLEIPTLVGWPSPDSIKVTNVTPDVKSPDENIGEIVIHGSNFDSLKEDQIGQFIFDNSKDNISTSDFEIIDDSKIKTIFNGTLSVGDYNLSISFVKVEESIKVTVLDNALIVE